MKNSKKYALFLVITLFNQPTFSVMSTDEILAKAEQDFPEELTADDVHNSYERFLCSTDFENFLLMYGI